MRKSLALLLISILFLGAWGGNIPNPPTGYAWEDGVTDIIPASHDRFYWYIYGAGLDDITWDEITPAIASLDAEVPRLRFINDSSSVLDPDEVRIAISVKPSSDPVPPECLDTAPGTDCVYGLTQCLQKVTTGGYDLCQSYKITIYWNRIIANTAARHPGEDPLDSLYPVTRHELTHVLGFEHDPGSPAKGPMSNGNNPLTACQLDTLNSYTVDPNGTTWTYSTPPSCL